MKLGFPCFFGDSVTLLALFFSGVLAVTVMKLDFPCFFGDSVTHLALFLS
jgi:hypothetical protein